MGVSEVDESSLFLDENLLKFMEQLELLEEKRAKLNSLIEQGWFSISKARYSMGNKHVSSLQYASEIQPLVCVSARKMENGEVQFCTEKPKANSSDEEPLPVEDIGPQERGVRRRNKSKKNEAEKEAEDSTVEKVREAIPVKRNDQNPQQDPLKWFGILVPQTLKQAQSSFKEVIELSAEIATLQTAVLKTRQELKLGLENQRSRSETLNSSGGKSSITNCNKSKQEEDEERLPAVDSQ